MKETRKLKKELGAMSPDGLPPDNIAEATKDEDEMVSFAQDEVYLILPGNKMVKARMAQLDYRCDRVDTSMFGGPTKWLRFGIEVDIRLVTDGKIFPAEDISGALARQYRELIRKLRELFEVPEGQYFLPVMEGRAKELKELRETAKAYRALRDRYAVLEEKLGQWENLRQVVTGGRSVVKRVLEVDE